MATRSQRDPSPTWTVRYTWRVPEGSTHREYTYTTHGSESRAIDRAVAALDNQEPSATLKVTSVHVRGPQDPKGTWRPVEWSA